MTNYLAGLSRVWWSIADDNKAEWTDFKLMVALHIVHIVALHQNSIWTIL